MEEKMAFMKKMLMLLVAGLFMTAAVPAKAAPPDFNADRRINVKCPTTIDRDRLGQFEIDGFKHTIRRLYHELEKNLWVSKKKDDNGYTFSNDPNEGTFFICHAKASFPTGKLQSLTPQAKIAFQEVFFITDIDWEKHRIRMVRTRDRGSFTIGINDFEKGFLWYNALLDKQKAYIPVYGFLSLPSEASAFPTIWDSWEGNKKDTATPPESLVDYDFYKILDYRNGYYLLGKDFNELDYRDNVEDYGIVGWVKKKYITLWRSRLYYHPLKRVDFFNGPDSKSASPETEEINRFYVKHTYLKERLFRDIVEKLDQESLHRFYTHFGFPQLASPEYGEKDPAGTTRVFIPGAFTPRLMKLLAKSLKKNLNTFFLLDVSESMRPFADYVKSFNNAVLEMKQDGIGLRVNRTFAYWDSSESDDDIYAKPNFKRIKRTSELQFAMESNDINYAEPLMRALILLMDEIESLQKKKVILPLHEKLLFVITDAGANDLTEDALALTAKKAKALNLNIYFIYPSDSGVRFGKSSLEDSPADAYKNLEDLIKLYETADRKENAGTFRKFKFKKSVLRSKPDRQKDFIRQQKSLLSGIKEYIDRVVGSGSTEIPRDVILYFSDEQLLTEMKKWSNRKIQVLNHVVKYIRDFESDETWEERIAIPAKPVEAYLRAVRTQDDVSLSDLKKLVIINSLVSVDDIQTSRKLYDYIKPLIEKRMFKTADAVFYRALTNKTLGDNTKWNSALGEHRGPLTQYLAKRGFHLNSFNQAVQRKFMYLKIDELYSRGN